MLIETFDKKLYTTVEDSIFALEEFSRIQTLSKNFDEILLAEPKKIYIPRRTSFKKFDHIHSFLLIQELLFR